MQKSLKLVVKAAMAWLEPLVAERGVGLVVGEVVELLVVSGSHSLGDPVGLDTLLSILGFQILVAG